MYFAKALLILLLFFLSEVEFVVEHSVAGNKVHKLLNNQRLNFIDSLNNSIGKKVIQVLL